MTARPMAAEMPTQALLLHEHKGFGHQQDDAEGDGEGFQVVGGHGRRRYQVGIRIRMRIISED